MRARAPGATLTARWLSAAMGMRTTQPAKPATMVTTRRPILARTEHQVVV